MWKVQSRQPGKEQPKPRQERLTSSSAGHLLPTPSAPRDCCGKCCSACRSSHTGQRFQFSRAGAVSPTTFRTANRANLSWSSTTPRAFQQPLHRSHHLTCRKEQLPRFASERENMFRDHAYNSMNSFAGGNNRGFTYRPRGSGMSNLHSSPRHLDTSTYPRVTLSLPSLNSHSSFFNLRLFRTVR